jgi:hypothetical protein
VIARLQGVVDPVVPPCFDLSPRMQHMPYNIPGPGFLGHAYKPSRMEPEDLALLKPPADVPPPRFDRRRALLGQFDQFRRRLDDAEVSGLDGIYHRAFDVLSSDKVAKALDLSREDPRLRDRYGIGSPEPVDDAAPRWNDQFLIARRLVEAGARCVTIAFVSWDTHGGNFDRLRAQLPLFDRGVSALVEDLHARGLDRDVTVVAWGEFGRTPKINKTAGRDHWSRVSTALLFGGRMNVGQVIGSTDKLVVRRPAGRCTTRTSWPPSTTTWASTPTPSSATRPTDPSRSSPPPPSRSASSSEQGTDRQPITGPGTR